MSNSCGAGKYCSTKDKGNGCQAGFCVPIPVTPEQGTKAPVCGCDGVTYWNESVAAKNGMSFRKQIGECGNGGTGGGGQETARCGGFAPTPCPNNAICNHRVESSDDCTVADSQGTCWQLPPTCTAINPLKSRACGPAIPPGPACKDECALIKSGQDWYPDTCP